MIIAFIGGIILGIIFFGGLYWSIRMLEKVKYPAVFMSISVLLRMAILLLGFFLLMDGSYKNILVALFGVIAVRFFMIFNLKSNSHPNTQKQKE